jgi:branched-chain amino acid transport system substrate-binding protein
MPGSVHAGQYSAVMHYLKSVAAVGVGKAKASGKAVIDHMKSVPTDDALFGKGSIRVDGRKIHDMHLFEVKSPAQSKKPWDYYIHKRVIPAAEAFRPLNEGGCPLVKA